jgi:hypothetical protein
MGYRLARDTPYQGNGAFGNDRRTAALENHDIVGVDDKYRIRLDRLAQGFRPLHEVHIGSQRGKLYCVDVIGCSRRDQQE